MVLSARNRSYDSEKTERELTEKEMDIFCNKLYNHATELSADQEPGTVLKKIGISKLISYKIIHEGC